MRSKTIHRTPEEVRELEAQLRAPYDPTTPIVSLVNCDDFEAEHYFNLSKKPHLSWKTLPSKFVFDEVYEKYCNGGYTTNPPTAVSRTNPPPFTVQKLEDLPMERESLRELPKIDAFYYNGHAAAWRLFGCVLYEFGHRFENGIVNEDWHKSIDWIHVSREIGRPFKIDNNFPTFLRDGYFDHVAPIVDAWISVLHQSLQRQLVAHEFPYNPSLSPLDRINTLRDAIRFLGARLRSPATLSEPVFKAITFDLRFDDPGRLDETRKEFVLNIATTKNLRFVARLLPSHLADLLMYEINWYLEQDQTTSADRGMAIKLLQDTSHYANKVPSHLKIEGFVEDEEMTENFTQGLRGAEAEIKIGHYRTNVVAVRWPKTPTEKSPSDRLDQHHRYRRGLVVIGYIKHENIVPFLGVCDAGHPLRPSILMEKMDHTVDEHPFEAWDPSASTNEQPYVKMIKGIVKGLDYLHSHDIAHGDFHWRNVLVDEERVPKIADFGFSRMLHPGENSTSVKPKSSGYTNFMPPEILKDRSKPPGLETDIFSCGVLLTALALPARGTKPKYMEKFLVEYAEAFQAGSDRSRPHRFGGLESQMADDLWGQIRKMTAAEERDRPKIGTVLQSLTITFPFKNRDSPSSF